MKAMLGILLTAAFGLQACGGEEVALNERLFEAGSMELTTGACYLYELGNGEQIGSGGGSAGGGGLQVGRVLDGDEVAIRFQQGGTTVFERRYGEPFFKSGALDEFTVSSSGGGIVARYWGKFHPNGSSGCAPADVNQP